MTINIPEISKQIYKEDILNVLDKKYSTLGPMWVSQQMDWQNTIYESFKDHDKYLMLIFLIKSGLDFYSRNFIKLSYEEFYSKNTIEIEKFNIAEVSKALNIPKESTRRKLFELENQGVIKKTKNRIIIDGSKFSYSKPEKSIKRMSRFLAVLSDMCVRENVLLKNMRSEEIEITIKKNFSYIWKIYFELQIPMMINYKKIFKDLESFHIFGACTVNQHLHVRKLSLDYMNRESFIKSLYTTPKMQGMNAMSISEITGIPRATVFRKLKRLVAQKNLSIDDKKHYKLTGSFTKILLPLQKIVIAKLAYFSTQVFNLHLFSKKD
jgi:predicted transcriptional regulator